MFGGKLLLLFSKALLESCQKQLFPQNKTDINTHLFSMLVDKYTLSVLVDINSLRGKIF